MQRSYSRLNDRKNARPTSKEQGPFVPELGENESIWTAPQSKLYPTAPPDPSVLSSAEQVKLQARQSAILKKVRISEAGGVMPAGWQRGSQLLGGVLSIGCAAYALIWHDFGETENVFSPVSSIFSAA